MQAGLDILVRLFSAFYKSKVRILRAIKKKKPALKKKSFFKKAPRIVLVAQEEYPSEDSDAEGETTTEVAALAIASATSTSLFESPNENLFTNNARCLMDHATEVPPSNL